MTNPPAAPLHVPTLDPTERAVVAWLAGLVERDGRVVVDFTEIEAYLDTHQARGRATAIVLYFASEGLLENIPRKRARPLSPFSAMRANAGHARFASWPHGSRDEPPVYEPDPFGSYRILGRVVPLARTIEGGLRHPSSTPGPLAHRETQVLLTMLRRRWTSPARAVSQETIAQQSLDQPAKNLGSVFRRLRGGGLVAATGQGAGAGTYLTPAGVEMARNSKGGGS